MTNHSGDDLRRRTVEAAGWSLGAQIAMRVVSFVVLVVLARLLAPDDFGLVAMITVVTGFATLFSDAGFGAALIQRPDLTEAHRSSVFWLTVAIGAGLTALVAMSAPLLAVFYGHPQLTGLTLVVSMDFLLTSFTVVPAALLRRNLRFRPLIVVDVVAVALGGSLAVTAAVLGAGVWSLPVFTLGVTSTRVVLLWSLGRWTPARIYDGAAVREVLPFSANLLGFKTVNYWIRNTDKLLIGALLSATALGLYTRSYALLMLPIGLIVGGVGSVLFPAMAEIQYDRPRVARLHLRAVRGVSLASFPIMAGLWAVAPDFVLAVFGPKWTGMIPIVQLFCIAGLLESIGSLNGNLYLSQGRADLQLRVGVIVGVLSIAAIALSVRWGVVAVAAAYTIYAAVAFFPSLHIAGSLVGLRVHDVLRAVAGTFVCALLMAAVVCALGRALPTDWPAALRLLLETAAGVTTYMTLLLAFRVSAWRDARAQWPLTRAA